MSDARLASAVVLFRGAGTDTEVYLVERAATMRFFGGYWAFPGGAVSPSDRQDLPTDEDAMFERCALRELIEETGIDMRGQPPGAGLSHVCTLTTPGFLPIRFETRFLSAVLPDGQAPEPDGTELTGGRFLRPADAVRLWERGEIQIAPPVLFLLRLITIHGTERFNEHAREAAAEINDGALHPVWFSPGIFMAPLATPTLPPATTTNTLIVGNDSLYVIDPATPDPREQERLFRVMDARIAAGARFEAILLTHHHADHVGAVNAVSSRYDLPVHAHCLTYERIPGGYKKGAPLGDGDVIELGTAPDGTKGWRLDVLHTPGHAVDHLCFIDSRYHAAVVGDMLSTVSTILIDPPEGHMRTYLESLNRLLVRPMTTLYPAHGPAHRDGHALIREYLEHRGHREEQALSALDEEARSIESLVAQIYTDVPREIWPLAGRSLLAELIKLREDGRCEETDTGWRKV